MVKVGEINARHDQPSTARPHGPIGQTSETIGARNPCRLFQKSFPAARHGRPSTAGSHGPLWRTSAKIGARNPCRLFQKSVPEARHGRPSTVDSHGPLWRTSATIGARNPCRLFQKSVPAARDGRPSTARSDELLQQSAPGIRAVCFKSPSRRPVTAVRPRPDPTARSGWLLQQSAWGIRAVCFKVHLSGPSRTSVTARSDELLKQTAPHTAGKYFEGLRCKVLQIESLCSTWFTITDYRWYVRFSMSPGCRNLSNFHLRVWQRQHKPNKWVLSLLQRRYYVIRFWRHKHVPRHSELLDMTLGDMTHVFYQCCSRCRDFRHDFKLTRTCFVWSDKTHINNINEESDK